MPATDQAIREFINDNFLFGEDSIADDESFLENGIIDSTGVLELVSFLETRFGFAVEDNELVPDNLDSINQLLNFVEAKLKQI